eukprot:353007-Chlamydomonas_euryale.AAC.3
MHACPCKQHPHVPHLEPARLKQLPHAACAHERRERAHRRLWARAGRLVAEIWLLRQQGRRLSLQRRLQRHR